MGDVKSWLTSKSVWGSLLAVVSTVLKMVGIDIGDTSGWELDALTLVGAALAIYGRIVAVKKIG